MRVAVKALMAASSLLPCSRMLTSDGLIAFSSGPWTVFRGKEWCPQSFTYSAWPPMASASTAFRRRISPPTTSLCGLAKVEAQKISERTRAGMARARAQGKRIGRPALPNNLREKIAARVAAGETPYAVAKALGIDRHTAAKYA